MNFLNNSEYLSQDFSSKSRFSLPFLNNKQNKISVKDSLQIINSEKKPNNHRQYLIGFIRDNNNKNRKSPTPKEILSAKNQEKNTNTLEKEEDKNMDEIFFFNDYFYYQLLLEKNDYNKINPDQLLDIFDYIGEDAKKPIELEIMNIKMNNFIPGRISTKSFGLINSYAANTNQGIDRNYNDDRVKIMINMNRPTNYMRKTPWPLISFFGIFDGHNGDHCAEFLRQNLLQYIYTNPNFPKNIEKSIKEAFIQADEDYLKKHSIIKNIKNIKKNANNHLNYYNNSGSCGLILLIVDTKIYIANVGDSRCIVSCNNGKIQKDVTRDHKPEFPYEKKRIYDNGGNIYRNETVFNDDIETKMYNKKLLGPYRVNPGKLSVSRTIGDAKAKIKKLGGKPNVIIPVPDIYTFDFYKDNIDYFILGCDGIFDRLKSYEVFQCVNIIINKTKELLKNNNKYNNSFHTSYDKTINMNTTCGNIVDMILRAAMLRKSYDNVTCIIVAFKDLLIENNSNLENKIKIKNDKLYVGRKSGYKNKNIKIIDFENYHRLGNNINNNDNDNKNLISKEIDKYNNTFNNIYNNNFLFIDKKKENESQKKSESKNKYEYIRHRRIPSQSQEKKFRELINLFSINNKKGNNDSSNILYKSYGSKGDILKKQQKLDIQIDKKDMSISNMNNIEKYNNHLNLYHKKKERMNSFSKKIDNENILRRKKFIFFKNNISDLKNNENNKINFSYIKKNKSIAFEINNNKAYLITDNNNLKNNNENDIEKNNGSNENEVKNKNKNLNETPNKNENLSKRITTRKIVRKTNNILNLNNISKEKIDNNNDNNNNDNKNDNIILENKNNENSEILKENQYLSYFKIKNIKNDIKNNFITEKYKYNRNLRYSSNLKNNKNYEIKQKENEIKNLKGFRDYKDILNKSGKYEKNRRAKNSNLPLSSSLGIIYTKKNKIK